MRLTPHSNGEPVREFNPCHHPPGPLGGKFCRAAGSLGRILHDHYRSFVHRTGKTGAMAFLFSRRSDWPGHGARIRKRQQRRPYEI